MSESKSSVNNSGIGFCGLLTIVFIVLKLLDKIDWSWWWVLSPFWVGIAAVLAFGVLVLIFYFLRAIHHHLTH